MKKVLSALLLIIILSTAACSNGSDGDKDVPSTTPDHHYENTDTYVDIEPDIEFNDNEHVLAKIIGDNKDTYLLWIFGNQYNNINFFTEETFHDTNGGVWGNLLTELPKTSLTADIGEWVYIEYSERADYSKTERDSFVNRFDIKYYPHSDYADDQYYLFTLNNILTVKVVENDGIYNGVITTFSYGTTVVAYENFYESKNFTLRIDLTTLRTCTGWTYKDPGAPVQIKYDTETMKPLSFIQYGISEEWAINTHRGMPTFPLPYQQ